MMTPTSHLRVGLNRQIVGKCDPDKLSYAGAWRNTRLTIAQLAEHIGKGHPWMPALLDGDRKRWQNNANYAEVLALDTDSGMTIEQAVEHPLAMYMALGIESSSSTPELNKFRSVFVLPEVILSGVNNECFVLPRGICAEIWATRECADLDELQSRITNAYRGYLRDQAGERSSAAGIPGESSGDRSPSERRLAQNPEEQGVGGRGECVADVARDLATILQSIDWDQAARFCHHEAWKVIRICNRYLASQWGHADPACKDASRFFFGAKDRQQFWLQDVTLFHDFLDRAIEWNIEIEARIAAEREQRSQYLATIDVAEQAELARDALAYIPAYTPGNGTYNDLITMCAGVVNDLGSTGEALLEAWNGFGRDTAKKVQGLARSDGNAGLGTLFWIAQQNGFRFPKREFTPEEKRAYGAAKRAEEDREKERTERLAIETSSTPSAIGLASCWDGPDTDEDLQALVEARTESENLPLEVVKQTSVEGWIQRNTDRLERQQAHAHSLDDTIATNEFGEYLLPTSLAFNPQESGILILNASMGAGKTSTVMKHITEQCSDRPILAFSPRNALAYQMGEVLGVQHHTKLQGRGYPRQATLCAESTYRVIAEENTWDEPPLLIFDEVSQTLDQLLAGETGRDNLLLNLSRLSKGLRRVKDLGGQILLSEDGITNLEVDFFKELSGLEVSAHTNFTKIYEPREYSILKNANAVVDSVLDRLTAGQNIICSTDSRTWAKALELHVLKATDIKNILVIDKDSVTEPDVVAFLADPDAWIADRKPRLIIYTPTLQSGVSIADPDGHFHAMAFNITHLTARTAKQLPERLRTNVPRFGTIVKSSGTNDRLSSSTDWKEIIKSLKSAVNANNQIIGLRSFLAEWEVDRLEDGNFTKAIDALDQAKVDHQDPKSIASIYLKYWAKYRARNNHDKKRIREDLIEFWESQGHTVTLVATNERKETPSAIAQNKKEIKAAEFQATANADISGMTHEIASKIMREPEGSSRDDRTAARKFLQTSRYPGCEGKWNSVEFLEKIDDRDHNFLRGTELFYSLQNPAETIEKEQVEWLSRIKKQKDGTRMLTWLPSHSNRAAIVDLLLTAPLAPFLPKEDGTVEVTEWHRETPEVRAILDWAQANRRKLIDLLNIGRGLKDQKYGTDILHKLLRKLGFRVEHTGECTGRRGNEKEIYTITDLDDPDRAEILGAIGLRSQKWKESIEQGIKNARRKPIAPEPEVYTFEYAYTG